MSHTKRRASKGVLQGLIMFDLVAPTVPKKRPPLLHCPLFHETSYADEADFDLEADLYDEDLASLRQFEYQVEQAADITDSEAEDESSLQELSPQEDQQSFQGLSLAEPSENESASGSWWTQSTNAQEVEAFEWELLSDVDSVKSFDVIHQTYADVLRTGATELPGFLNETKKRHGVSDCKKVTFHNVASNAARGTRKDSSPTPNVFLRNDPFVHLSMIGEEKVQHRGRRSRVGHDGKVRWKRY
jgi:hypothetical protein